MSSLTSSRLELLLRRIVGDSLVNIVSKFAAVLEWTRIGTLRWGR